MTCVPATPGSHGFDGGLLNVFRRYDDDRSGSVTANEMGMMVSGSYDAMSVQFHVPGAGVLHICGVLCMPDITKAVSTTSSTSFPAFDFPLPCGFSASSTDRVLFFSWNVVNLAPTSVHFDVLNISGQT